MSKKAGKNNSTVDSFEERKWGGGCIRPWPFGGPVTDMNIVIAAELCGRAVIIAIKKTRTREQGRGFNQKRKKYCKRLG